MFIGAKIYIYWHMYCRMLNLRSFSLSLSLSEQQTNGDKAPLFEVVKFEVLFSLSFSLRATDKRR